MKVKQDKSAYKPIKITLETREEAEALFNFVENWHQSEPVSSPERNIAIDISNALSGKI